MKIRATEERDLPAVMEILHQAQAYFKAQGIDQWQDGYPDEATIRQDIQNGTAYLCRTGWHRGRLRDDCFYAG